MQNVIELANQIVKGASFTKIVKSRKNAGVCFLIVALSDGGSLYASYSSNAVYYIAKDGQSFGLR